MYACVILVYMYIHRTLVYLKDSNKLLLFVCLFIVIIIVFAVIAAIVVVVVVAFVVVVIVFDAIITLIDPHKRYKQQNRYSTDTSTLLMILY